MKKYLFITLAAAALASGITYAQTSTPGAQPGRDALVRRAVEHLGLTAEQMAKIKAEIVAEKETILSLVSRYRDTKKALGTTIRNVASETEIRAAAAKVAAVEADAAVARARIYGKIKPILTAEQLEKVDQLGDKVDTFIDSLVKRAEERLAK